MTDIKNERIENKVVDLNVGELQNELFNAIRKVAGREIYSSTMDQLFFEMQSILKKHLYPTPVKEEVAIIV